MTIVTLEVKADACKCGKESEPLISTYDPPSLILKCECGIRVSIPLKDALVYVRVEEANHA